MSEKRVSEGTQLPRTEMCRHENYTAADAQRVLVILKTVLYYEFGNVAFIHFRKVTEFHEKASEIAEASPQNLKPLVIGKLRKRHLKIAEACRTLAASQMEAEPRYRCGRLTGDFAGHCAEGCKKEPSHQVFDLLFNAAAHPWYFHILCETGIQ
jgi:hypothetical protein